VGSAAGSQEVQLQVGEDYFLHFVREHLDLTGEGEVLRNVVEEPVRQYECPYGRCIPMTRMVVDSWAFVVVAVEEADHEEGNVPNTAVLGYSDVPSFEGMDRSLHNIAD
jgi:hypothetical protein